MEGLDLALRHDPRLLFRLVVLFVLGLAAVVGLGYLGTYLAPPHGLRVFGESLSTWGLIVLVALLIAKCWWEGRAVGYALRDTMLLRSPILGLTVGLLDEHDRLVEGGLSGQRVARQLGLNSSRVRERRASLERLFHPRHADLHSPVRRSLPAQGARAANPHHPISASKTRFASPSVPHRVGLQSELASSRCPATAAGFRVAG